jgi:hypothetical protein
MPIYPIYPTSDFRATIGHLVEEGGCCLAFAQDEVGIGGQDRFGTVAQPLGELPDASRIHRKA